MAKKKILQDKDGQIWPVTVADCVYLTDGSKTIKKYIDDGLAAKTDNKVTYTLGTTTKYYMAGPTATATGTGGITFDTGIYATTTAGQLSVGSLQTRGAITTSGNGSHAIGSTSNRFSGIYGANIYSYDQNAKQYASLKLQTEGTAETQGVGRITAGNNTNTGTAGNAKGQVLLYGTNTGYTLITPGYNSTSSITLTLPSATGTLISNNQATFTTMPKFNMNDRNGSIFEIFGGDANGHGVRFGGGGCTFVGSGESAANIITEESTSPTDEQLYVTSDNNIYFYTKCGTIAERRKATLNGSLNFYPDKALGGSIGHADYPWLQMFADTYHIYGAAGKTYGHLNVQTVGTTSTVGETRLVLGNSTAEGTADNSWGRICLYTKSAGYTYMQPGTNTSAVTLTLPNTTGIIATEAYVDNKASNYLPLAGGTMTGDINIKNAKAIKTALAAAATKTDGTTVAAGTYIDTVKMSSGDNIHVGAGVFDNSIKTGTTYVTGGGNLILRTVEGAVDIKPGNSSILSVSTSAINAAKEIYAKVGIKTGGNIVSDTALTDNIGTDAIPFNYTRSRYFQIYGEASKQYGNLRADTLGTTSAVGQTILTLGNSTASGTAGNAQGEINFYSSGTGYVKLKNRTALSSNVTIQLPSASGQIPIMVTDDADYWGILPPSGTESSWLRSPKSGLIPFEKNSEVSSLGTSSWPWYNVCGKNFGMYDKNGQTYGFMKVVTDGTADTQGEARLSLGNSISNGAAKNSYGRIALYGTNTGYTMITPGNNSTSNITITLPSSGGTLARTADNVNTASALYTARTLKIGATGKSFDGSENVTWTLQEIAKGQGLTAGTACGTLYYNNAGVDHVGRLSCYRLDDTKDYVQISLYQTAESKNRNYINIYEGKMTTGSAIDASGHVTLNPSKTADYFAFDTYRKCDSGTATYSSARLGCVNNYGGCAQVETKHDGTTKGYLRVLPNNGIQLGSGKKLHIQASAPTANVATGDVWIDV